MEADPYRPPQAPLTRLNRLGQKLYSPGQIAGATLLGSPFAGCWCLAHNFAALGNDSARIQSLVWGAVSTAGLMVLSMFLPGRGLGTLGALAPVWALHALAK